MSESITSGVSVNTNTTSSTISPEFATAMASVPWYAGSTADEQQALHAIWLDCGVPAEEYALDAVAFASAQELLVEEMGEQDAAEQAAFASAKQQAQSTAQLDRVTGYPVGGEFDTAMSAAVSWWALSNTHDVDREGVYEAYLAWSTPGCTLEQAEYVQREGCTPLAQFVLMASKYAYAVELVQQYEEECDGAEFGTEEQQEEAECREEFNGAMSYGVTWWVVPVLDFDAVYAAYAKSGMATEEFAARAATHKNAAALLASLAPAPEPTPTSTIKQANDTLDKFGVACKEQAECNYGMMRLASQFVDEFLGVAPGKSTRTTAVERLAEKWMREDYDATDIKPLRTKVNLLLRVNAVATLLGDGRGVAKGDGTKKGRGKGKKDGAIGWAKLRELSPLVERWADDHCERWSVLPHVAAKAVALVAEIAASEMDRADVVKAVEVLVAEEVAARIEEAKQQAEADKVIADAKRAEELRLRKELADKKREADALLEAARKPDAAPEVVQQAQAAVAVVAAKQEEVQAATAVTEQAAKQASASSEADRKAQGKQADLDAKQAAKEKKAAERKAAGKATPQAPPTPTAHQGTNLLAPAVKGTVKDMAEFVVEYMTDCDVQDDLAQQVARLLSTSKEHSKATQKAFLAAYTMLANATQSSHRTVTPAAAAKALAAQDAKQVNGQLVAAQ